MNQKKQGTGNDPGLYRSVATATGLRIRERGDGAKSRTIEGTAIVFGELSDPRYEDGKLVIREKIAPEAVTKEFLDKQDILMTLYHDNDRILARSVNGEGTLSYDVDETGVHFSFEAPKTEDGNTALEHIRRGDLTGCSFAFRSRYFNGGTTKETGTEGNKKLVVYTVRKMESIEDFTIVPRPAYETTALGISLRDAENAENAGELKARETAIKNGISELRKLAR